ncbi:uncharacterized protein LOC132546883 [Ylistrum balloti]|uniref:uncharacterized protein LOC132546883 n=1 Tax=Ylistrum balloti TaxID=509963 RepID=UPI0029059E9B|nr:uncharacterized protein LOC132546883 [Ylistrum balloti]
MNTILLFAVAVLGILSDCCGHIIYHRRKIVSPLIHRRVVIPHRIYIHRYPTYMVRKGMGTIYPTKGHGPFYRPSFPANINTFHPQATVTPNFIVPSSDLGLNKRYVFPTTGGTINHENSGIVNTGFVVPREAGVIPSDVNVVGTPDFASSVPTFPNLGINSMFDTGDKILISGVETGIGFKTKDVDADGKPVVQEQNKNGDQATTPDSPSSDTGISSIVVTDPGNGEELPIITPVIITDASDSNLPDTGLPDMTFPEIGLPDTNKIFPGVEGEKQNSSCHQTGCDTGAECVFAEEYICPSYIPSVACECRLGCRLDYTFIPLGGSITIDVCGNTCSCNNMYGAAECTQRMCKPEDPTISITGTVSSDADLGGFQGAFDSLPTAKIDSGFEISASSSNRVTVPELQQFIEPMNVVEKIVNDSSLPETVSQKPGDELNNVTGISNTDVTTTRELSTESPLV